MSDIVFFVVFVWAAWFLSGIYYDSELVEQCQEQGYMETYTDGTYSCSKQVMGDKE